MEGAGIQNYLGRITQVIDLDNFWMQIGTDESMAEFMQFEINIEDYGRTMATSPDDIDEVTMGQTLLIDCTNTGHMWRRGQVSRLDRENEQADVFYLDYGETELVDVSRLCVEFPDDFICYPAQAVRCCIAGIKPIAKHWTSRAVKRFKALVEYDIFQTVVLGFQPGNYKVILYTQEGDEGRAISLQLLDEELAMPNDDDVPEFYRDAPKHFQSNQSELELEGQYSEASYDSDVSVEVEYKEYSTENSSSTNKSTQDQSTGSVRSDVCGESSDSDSSDGEEQLGIQMSPQIIPGFDFNQIQKTQQTSTSKLKEKEERHKQRKIEKEMERLNEELEKAKLAAAEFSGLKAELTDEEEDNVEERQEPPESTVQMDNKTADKPLNQNHPTRRYGPRRREVPLRFHKSHGTPEQDRGNSSYHSPSDTTSSYNQKVPPVEIPPRFQKTRAATEHDRGNSPYHSSPVQSPSYNQKVSTVDLEIPPRFNKLNESLEEEKGTLAYHPLTSGEGNVVPLCAPSQQENIPAEIGPLNIAKLQEISPTKINFLKLLNQGFSHINKEDLDMTTARLRSLFSTDLFLYLEKQHLQDVVNILLNRAVRHYGDIHDVILEILELLQVTQDFEECMVKGVRKLLDMYIKVQTKGSSFHVECSKVLGYLFNMSFFWDESSKSIQKCILGDVEKWLYFNKKGTQRGQEALEEIYLESFKTIWNVISHITKEKHKEKVRQMQWECKDKLFSAHVARSIKEKLFDMYMECFLHDSPVITTTTACQTDAQLLDSQNEEVTLVTNTHKIHQDKMCTSKSADDKELMLTPSHMNNKDFTLMTPKSFERQSMLTPGSENNSAYFTPNETPNSSEFPSLTTDKSAFVLPKIDSVPQSTENQISWAAMVSNSSTPKQDKKQSHVSKEVRDNRTKQDNKQNNVSKVNDNRTKQDSNSNASPSGRSIYRNSKAMDEKDVREPISMKSIMTDFLYTHTKDNSPHDDNATIRNPENKGSSNDQITSSAYGDNKQDPSTPKYGQPTEKGDNSHSDISSTDLNQSKQSSRLLNDHDSETSRSTKQNDLSGPPKKQKSTHNAPAKDIDWFTMGVDDDNDESDEDNWQLGWPENDKFSDEEDNINVTIGEIKPPAEVITFMSKDTRTLKPPPGFPEISKLGSSSSETNSASKQSNPLVSENVSDSDPAWETVDEDEDDKPEKPFPTAEILIHESVKPTNKSASPVGMAGFAAEASVKKEPYIGPIKTEISPRHIGPQRTQSPSWQPRVRTCTQCGDTNHTIYQCPNKTSFFFS